MTDKSYSLQSLNEFLDYLGNKDLLNKNTVQSRKGAVNKILGILDEQEASDIRALDFDLVFQRFVNRVGKDYKPDSLMVYKSRLSSAVTDFLAYMESPAQFRPSSKPSGSGAVGSKKAGKATRKPDGKREDRDGDSGNHSTSRTPPPVTPGTVNVPVPLREGVTVHITGLPVDLSEAEAARLAAIIKAYAMV